nr:XRE family transcriptional regulator [Fodinicola acaciae]
MLKRLRQAAGMSQEALALHASLSPRAVSDMETGRTRRPHPTSVRSLASALSLPAAPASALMTAARPPISLNDDLQALGRDNEQLCRPERNLLSGAPEFIGREGEFAGLLRTIIEASGRPGNTVAIYVVEGMAGVGKTAVVTHLARLLRDCFPDGIAYIDLCGHTPDHPPLPTTNALTSLLRRVGVDRADIPDRLDDRVLRWRAEMADRRMIVILDDALDPAQVRPLLPGAGRCLVLVTSRRKLSALDTATAFHLDVPSSAEAIQLFMTFTEAAGIAGLDADATVFSIVHACGNLPLALRICASLLRERLDPADLAARLADPVGALGELAADGLSVRASLASSFRTLPVAYRGLVHRLSLHPEPTFDAGSAAILAGVEHGRIEDILDALVDGNFLTAEPSGRYAFHRLTRQFARSAASGGDIHV